MNTIDKILTSRREGRITRQEAVVALARLITPDNVTDIMAGLPADVAADVDRWASSAPPQGGLVIGANLTKEETLWIGQQLQVASQAVREWKASSAMTHLDLTESQIEVLVELYDEANCKSSDDLPYTEEFERLYSQFLTRADVSMDRHYVWKALCKVRKAGKLPPKVR
jgi:hypothetical protein